MLLCVCAIYEDSGPKKHIYRLKTQVYNGSLILPDYNKNKRWEEERGKADAFIEDFHIVYELFKESDNPKDKHCCDSVKPYRVCFIS